MQQSDLVNALRECSDVERCHTLPHHGSYSVGKHSYDAVMLLFTLYPGEPSMALVKAMLSHDLGERWCGDIPAPAKWSDGEYAKRSAALERRCLIHIGWDIPLDAEDQRWLSAIDKVELYLWAQNQIRMGFAVAGSVVGNLLSWFKHADLPPEVHTFLTNHNWQRTPEQLPK
jgi:5'-deoxynucleotidase YfbR-like HD superfamily hydrolase